MLLLGFRPDIRITCLTLVLVWCLQEGGFRLFQRSYRRDILLASCVCAVFIVFDYVTLVFIVLFRFIIVRSIVHRSGIFLIRVLTAFFYRISMLFVDLAPTIALKGQSALIVNHVGDKCNNRYILCSCGLWHVSVNNFIR